MDVLFLVLWLVVATFVYLVIQGGILSFAAGWAGEMLEFGRAVAIVVVGGFGGMGLSALLWFFIGDPMTVAYAQGPLSLLMWTGIISGIGKMRIGAAAITAVAASFANTVMLVFAGIALTALLLAPG